MTSSTSEPDRAAAPPLRFTPAWVEHERTADGARVRLRLLRGDDRDRLVAGFGKLSPESRYLRFFTAMPRLPEAVLHRLLDCDGTDHVAIGAETDDTAAEGLGIARFVRLPDAPDTADAAVAVVDHAQRRGIGKLLLAALAGAARERGIDRFRVETLRSNDAVQALLHDAGDGLRLVANDGNVAVYEVALGGPTAEREVPGTLAALLRLAATGLRLVARRLEALT